LRPAQTKGASFPHERERCAHPWTKAAVFPLKPLLFILFFMLSFFVFVLLARLASGEQGADFDVVDMGDDPVAMLTDDDAQGPRSFYKRFIVWQFYIMTYYLLCQVHFVYHILFFISPYWLYYRFIETSLRKPSHVEAFY